MDQNLKEQFRMVTKVFDILNSKSDINLETYVEIVNSLGTGMAAHLRLTPGRELASRLSHLYAVVAIASMEKPLFKNQALLSVENLGQIYKFDCDLILEDLDDSTIYLIDVTASSDYDVIRDKHKTLEQKSFDPSLQGRRVIPYVHKIVPKLFRILIPYFFTLDDNDRPETYTHNLLEFMNSRSDVTKASFFASCNKIYDETILNLSKVDHNTKLYNSTKSNLKKIDIAAEACMTNDPVKSSELFLNSTKRDYQPFVKALQKLTAQSHTLKNPFIHYPSPISRHKGDLDQALTSLKDDPLANCLRLSKAIPKKVIAIKTNLEYDILDKFPTDSKTSRAISVNSDYVVAAKYIEGHYFKIKFSYDFMDKNLRRIIYHEKKPEIKIDKNSESSLESCIQQIKDSERELNKLNEHISKQTVGHSDSTIWDKVLTIARLSREDLGNVGKVSSNLLISISILLKKTLGGSLVSNLYEITKTFSASIKNSHSDDTFYVGVNGPIDSVTITKLSSTQDSFNRTHYCTVGRLNNDDSSRQFLRGDHFYSKTTCRSSFRTMDHNEVVYNLKLPYSILSLVTWDIESNLKLGRVDMSKLPNILTCSILHTLVNRDTFAQAAQQVRYLYTSSIGFGADPTKIVDKFDFFIPRTHWEFIYIYRMIKLGLSLSIIRDNNSLDRISVDGELQVAFPHSKYPSSNFSQTVSSMYYCNIFNKFRAFHEVSEAYCYNELDDELDIYNESNKSNFYFSTGISRQTCENVHNIDYLLSEDFVENEIEFNKQLIAAGQGRFRGSVPFIIAASKLYCRPSESNISDIYHNLNKSPIEACTMRGSMSSGPATDKSQGCRAASAILEVLIEKYDMKPEQLNKNSWLSSLFVEKIQEMGGDSSIFTLVVNQLVDSSIEYIYRIVQKDQVGNREISVLNAVFRIGALFTESIARTLSPILRDIDILEDPDKDSTFETEVKKSFLDDTNNVTCYDNSDQKRWGPNHLLSFFSAMFFGILNKERGLMKLILFVSDRTMHKRAKFPESLIKLFNKSVQVKNSNFRIGREGLNEEHGSETLKTFYRNNANNLFNNKFDKELPYGMCQGIFHSTSSLFHAIMCKVIEEVAFVVFKKDVSIKSFCTSDDSSRIIKISTLINKLLTIRKIHSIITSVGALFNIIRNEAKSSFNFHIAEFNSIFFKNGTMATPSLKQRIAKIDVGSGSNHVEDYLAVISAASNYFTVGGSYAGATVLSILNITLHTEQWSRWDFAKAEHYYKPVELGGFPVIEPLSTCLSGAISNIYLRSKREITSKRYATLFASIMTETPEQFTLQDYFRVPKPLSDDSNSIKIFKNSGALGLFSLVRTDKKLSQFEIRHKMSRWNIPDNFVSLNHKSPDSKYFLYNIYRNGCMSLFSEAEGVNSFYKRFTDPWLSRTRKCFKPSKRSVFVALGLDSSLKYSYSELSDVLLNQNKEDSSSVMESIYQLNPIDSNTLTLVDQMKPRLDDASEIYDFILSQECSDYVKSSNNPATSRVTLRGFQAIDQDKYTADLLKVLSGEGARYLITDYFNDHKIFDHLPSSKDCPNIPIKDAIILADNSVNVFNKFVKRNTKIITSGKPANLSSLVTMILKSRFFEGFGIRLVGSLKLIGDRSHAFSFTSWYKELNSKSEYYQQESSEAALKQTYADVVKYGIKADKPIITVKDHFTIDDTATGNSHVKINSLSRGALCSFVKTWVSAKATFSFDFNSLKSLFSNKLLNRNEYKTGPSKFIRTCHDIYFDVFSNNCSAIHLLEVDTSGPRDLFRHIFLVDNNHFHQDVEFHLTEAGNNRSWCKSISSYFNREKQVTLDKTYYIDGDTCIFKCVDTTTVFSLGQSPRSLTISLISDDYLIPITHATSKSITEIKLGYKLDANSIVNSVRIFNEMLNRTDSLKNKNKIPNLEHALYAITYSFNYHSRFSDISKVLTKLKFPFKFDNNKEIDIFKTLLLNENTSSLNIKPSRLYQHINNLFETSNTKNSYLSDLTIEDRLSLRLDSRLIDTSDSADIDIDLNDDIHFNETAIDLADFVKDAEEEDDFIDVNIDDEDESDDIDFEDYDLEDDLDANENLFEVLSPTFKIADSEQVTIKSSRTGLTINPIDEYPFAILSHIKNWIHLNRVNNIFGLSDKIKNIIDIPSAFLFAARLGSIPSSTLLHELLGSDSIDLPCPLSDLVSINAVTSG